MPTGGNVEELQKPSRIGPAMRRTGHCLALLLAACGPMPSVDAGHDAGEDAGSDAGQTVRVSVTWGGTGCSVCMASRDLTPSEATAARASFNSALNGFMCNIDESDAGVSVNCVPRCALPGKPDAGTVGCDWVPCLDGPLVCR